MLNDDDKTYVTDRLAAALNVGDPRTLLGTVLPNESMLRIRLQQLPLAYALEALRVCVEDRWNHLSCWLLLLMQLLPNEDRTVAIRKRIEVPVIEPDPALATVLITEVPFLDREPLRKKVRALAQDKVTRPILVVTGEHKTGKTFTGEFIQHLHLSGVALEFCRVKFPVGDGLTFGPVQVAKRILEDAGVSVNRLPATFFDNTTNNTRWPYDLAGQVLNECLNTVTKPFWIVLDAFGGSEFREDTRKFVDGLADRMTASSIFSGKFRLLLLGFDRSLLTVQPFLVDVERISPPGQTHVAECIAAIFDRFKQPPPDLNPLIARITDQLPGGEQHMIELHQRLCDLMAEVREAAHA